MRLRLAATGWPGFAPGQFVMLSPGAVGEAARSDPLLPRPMAVYRQTDAGDTPAVEVLYRVEGRGTQLLAEASPGQRIALVGPLGRGFPAPVGTGPALLVAGGTGIASIYELARRLAPEREVAVLLGARDAGGLMGLADFEALDVALELVTEDGSRGQRGLVTEALEARLAGAVGATAYACGPTPMMQRCAELAAEAGAACHVSLENRMACGFGVCLGCAAPLAEGGFALVCRDGPVFDAERIDWSGMP